MPANPSRTRIPPARFRRYIKRMKIPPELLEPSARRGNLRVCVDSSYPELVLRDQSDMVRMDRVRASPRGASFATRSPVSTALDARIDPDAAG